MVFLDCPQMVIVPPVEFDMGEVDSAGARHLEGKVQHKTGWHSEGLTSQLFGSRVASDRD